MSTPNYQAEINRLEALLNSATKDVSIEGVRTSFDLSEARKRLAELRQLQGQDLSRVRPRVSSLWLGNAY